MVLVSGVDVQVGVGMLCFEVWSDVKCSVTRVYVCGVYVWRGLDVVFVVRSSAPLV